MRSDRAEGLVGGKTSVHPGATQAPAAQLSLAGQTCPQAPQSEEDVWRLSQPSAQAAKPELQEAMPHVPEAQDGVPFGTLHA
jgi:hypothetical protein